MILPGDVQRRDTDGLGANHSVSQGSWGQHNGLCLLSRLFFFFVKTLFLEMNRNALCSPKGKDYKEGTIGNPWISGHRHEI